MLRRAVAAVLKQRALMTCITCGCRARTMSSGWSLSMLMTCARSHSTTHRRPPLARHRFMSRHGGCTLCTYTYTCTYTSPGSRQPARSLRQAARAGDCQSAGTLRGCGFKAVCGRGPEGAAGLPCAAMCVIYQANAARPRKRKTRLHVSTRLHVHDDMSCAYHGHTHLQQQLPLYLAHQRFSSSATARCRWNALAAARSVHKDVRQLSSLRI